MSEAKFKFISSGSPADVKIVSSEPTRLAPPVEPTESGLATATLWAVAGRIVSVSTSVALVPLLLHRIGVEGYGQWAAAIAIASLIGLSDAGLGRGILSMLPTDFQSATSREKTQSVVSSAFAIYVVVALIGITALSAGAFLTSWRTFGGTSAAVAGLVLLGLPLGVFQAVLIAQKKIWRNHAGAAAGSLLGLGTVAALPTRSLPILAAGWLLGPTLTFAWLSTRLVSRHPWARPRLHHFSRTIVRELFSRSLQYGVLQVCYVVAVSSDVIIVNAILGSNAAGQYAVPAKAVSALTGLSGLVTLALWPVVRNAKETGSRRDAVDACKTLVALSTGCAVLVGVAIFFAGNEVLAAWTQRDIRMTLGLRLSLGVLVPVIHLACVLGSILSGMDIVRPQVVAGVLMACANVFLSVVLTERLGTSGPAWASIIAYIFTVLLPLLVLFPRWTNQAFPLNARPKAE